MDDYMTIYPSMWSLNLPIEVTQIDGNFGMLYSLNISTSITLLGLALSVISILISKSHISISSYMKHIIKYDGVIPVTIIYLIALVVTICTAYLRYTYFVDLWLKLSLIYPLVFIILIAWNISKIESSKFIFQEMSSRIINKKRYLAFYSDIFLPYQGKKIYQETARLLQIVKKEHEIGFNIYQDINSKLFEIEDEEAKLEFLIKTAYFISPSPLAQSYKEDMSMIIDAIFDAYTYCIITKKKINTVIILNLKELVYFHFLFFNELNFTSEEKNRIVSTYSKVIETAAKIIGITVTNLGICSQLVINQINNYIAYTQFFASISWRDSKENIQMLVKQHEHELTRITYRILYLIITDRLSPKVFFRSCRAIIDEFGFRNYGESIDIFFEDLIILSTVHTLKYTYVYITHVFLCAIAVIESEDVVRSYIARWLDAENISNRTSELRSFLHNIDKISYLDIQPIVLGTEEIINKGKETIKAILTSELDDSIKNDDELLEQAPISENKLSKLIIDIKELFLFKDFVPNDEEKGREFDNGEISFTLPIFKIAVIEQGNVLFWGIQKLRLLAINEIALHINRLATHENNINITSLDEIKPGFDYLIFPFQSFLNKEFEGEFEYSNFFSDEILINNRKFMIQPTDVLNKDLIIAISSPLYFCLDDIQITMGSVPKRMNCEPMINLDVSISYTCFKDFSVVKYLMVPINKGPSQDEPIVVL